MAIFSRFKGSKEKKDSKAAKSDEPKAPVKREPYIPRYAVRDALQCAPSTWKQDSYDAFRKAHQERFAREQGEMNCNGFSNPKLSSRLSMSMSRNSSALSVGMMDSSRPSSRRHSMHASPWASGPSSYVSISGLAPGEVPVPAIPAQYASQVSTPGPSTPRSLSRNSSFQQQHQSLEAHLASAPLTRPNPPFRHSFSHPPQSIMKKTVVHDFGSNPVESPNETPVGSRSVSPTDNVNVTVSSAASTASESSSEVLEMPPRHDSLYNLPQMAPVFVQKQRTYPADPRKLGKAPVITIEESTPSTRKYFSHAVKPVDASAPPSPQSPPPKKARFSLIRRSQAVSAH